MANEDLTWETTLSHNIGIDFSFLRSRINGSVELYHNTTRDLLIQFPTAGSGYAYQYRNMGSVLNRGAELSLNLVLVEKKNFGLTFSGNISFNQNRVLRECTPWMISHTILRHRPGIRSRAWQMHRAVSGQKDSVREE